jgi:hypothetical protein
MAKATPPIGLGTDSAHEDFKYPRYSGLTEVRSTLLKVGQRSVK